MQSLYKTLGLENDPEFEGIGTNSNHPSDPITLDLGGSSLNLMCNEKDRMLNIHYLASTSIICEERNHPYFDNVWIDYNTWANAARLAFDDYFA
jgi:hypothetical protein